LTTARKMYVPTSEDYNLFLKAWQVFKSMV
jgi:hypothetical protein